MGKFGKMLKEWMMERCWKDGLEKKYMHNVEEYIIVLQLLTNDCVVYSSAYIDSVAPKQICCPLLPNTLVLEVILWIPQVLIGLFYLSLGSGTPWW